MSKKDKVAKWCVTSLYCVFFGGMVGSLTVAILWDEYDTSVAVIGSAIFGYLWIISIATFIGTFSWCVIHSED
jgi:hypothetical protein